MGTLLPEPPAGASGQDWADEASSGIVLLGPHPAPAEPRRGRGRVQSLCLPTPSSRSAGQISVLGGEQGYRGRSWQFSSPVPLPPTPPPPLPSCIPGHGICSLQQEKWQGEVLVGTEFRTRSSPWNSKAWGTPAPEKGGGRDLWGVQVERWIHPKLLWICQHQPWSHKLTTLSF